MINIQTCIVIGAGISGLLVASKLQANEVKVQVIDKGRLPGGRMATKLMGEAVFDHGAQFVTTRERVFREMVEEWMSQGVVKPWYRGPLGNMRYVGIDGMRAIPALLAGNLNVALSEKAVKLHFEDGKWTVTCLPHGETETKEYTADFLVFSTPVPQTMDLLATANVELDYDEEEELKRIQYRRCISVLAQLNGPAGLPNPGAMDLNHPVLRWIGDNSVKGVSSREGSVTINSSSRFADAHWDTDPDTRAKMLLAAAKPFLKSDVVEFVSHRWGYSEPTRLYKERQPFRKTYLLDENLRLAMCGDGFGGPRIEAAAMSGLALADELTSPI
ncbi:MAG: FAD-dependent oxidoreductase [Verrucomicrobia bacterium]|nr:FAD-dependent oxidoreductase [Verrucomicrobiota bacterium]